MTQLLQPPSEMATVGQFCVAINSTRASQTPCTTSAPTATKASPRQTTYPAAGPSWVCKKAGMCYGADRIWRNAKGQPCKPPRTLGVHVWAAYSPQRTWASIVDEFEKPTAPCKPVTWPP